MHQHESASADVARSGKGHGKREPNRHGRINCVAAFLQNRKARLGGMSFGGDHHAVLGGNGPEDYIASQDWRRSGRNE